MGDHAGLDHDGVAVLEGGATQAARWMPVIAPAVSTSCAHPVGAREAPRFSRAGIAAPRELTSTEVRPELPSAGAGAKPARPDPAPAARVGGAWCGGARRAEVRAPRPWPPGKPCGSSCVL